MATIKLMADTPLISPACAHTNIILTSHLDTGGGGLTSIIRLYCTVLHVGGNNVLVRD